MDTPTLISTSVYPGWKCNLRDNVSFIINNIVGGALAKKMKVAVKGGAAVDPESGSGQRLNLPPLFPTVLSCWVRESSFNMTRGDEGIETRTLKF